MTLMGGMACIYGVISELFSSRSFFCFQYPTLALVERSDGVLCQDWEGVLYCGDCG
jgi:hypothetical protein